MKNPKIIIPLVIILIALGAFAAKTMNRGGDYGHSQSDHGHEH
tara:strand:+ start:7490 stop:7618 length:129 start_codon:yes stop_codon:yes gene_type:complete